MTLDARGWRIALAPDSLVNAPPAGAAGLDLIALLEELGYGLIVMPPLGPHRLLLEVIADQVAELAHHGYAVVAIGSSALPGHGLHWRSLTRLLRARGTRAIPRRNLQPGAAPEAERRRLEAWLSGYNLPASEREHWRR